MPRAQANPGQLGAEAYGLLPHVRNALRLNDSQYNKLVDRVHCFSFQVRLPNALDRSCNKTPFINRWEIGPSSYLRPESALYATQPQCEEVAAKLLALLFECNGITFDINQVTNLNRILVRAPSLGSLTCLRQNQILSVGDIKQAILYTTGQLGAYNLPITYIQELNAGGLHRATNISWLKPLHINYKLRDRLKSDLLAFGATNTAAQNVLSKIQVKAYCTDKVTMPPFYSNRDIRWATWPESNQYASYYECAMIELEMMAQLYEFYEAPTLPEDLAIEVANVRGRSIQPNLMTCYTTGSQMSFRLYVEAATNPQGGRSAYHVGHKVPLTREGGRHTWTNVAWVTDSGNRIQGNETVAEIEQKLIEAVVYHLKRDLANGNTNIEAKVRQLFELLNHIRGAQGLPAFEW